MNTGDQPADKTIPLPVEQNLKCLGSGVWTRLRRARSLFRHLWLDHIDQSAAPHSPAVLAGSLPLWRAETGLHRGHPLHRSPMAWCLGLILVSLLFSYANLALSFVLVAPPDEQFHTATPFPPLVRIGTGLGRLAWALALWAAARSWTRERNPADRAAVGATHTAWSLIWSKGTIWFVPTVALSLLAFPRAALEITALWHWAPEHSLARQAYFPDTAGGMPWGPLELLGKIGLGCGLQSLWVLTKCALVLGILTRLALRWQRPISIALVIMALGWFANGLLLQWDQAVIRITSARLADLDQWAMALQINQMAQILAGALLAAVIWRGLPSAIQRTHTALA